MVKTNLTLKYPNALFKGIGTQFGVVFEILRKKIRVHLGGIEGSCFKSFLCCVDLYLIGKTIYCVETPPPPPSSR